VTVCAWFTDPVVAVKVAEEFPGETETLGGTESNALPLLRVATSPFGAAFVNRTVHCVEALPVIDVGEQRILLSWAEALAVTDKVVELFEVDAVIVAGVSAVTAVTPAANDAVLCPEATCKLAGTVIAGLELESATETPLAGAGAARVTVQLKLPGPIIAVGVQASPLTPGDGARAIVAD
jgi:hypothetical protein